MLYRVYVDESGDRGMGARSTDHFVTSAVIVPDGQDRATRDALAQLRDTLGREPGHVIHFRRLSHSQKIRATQDVAGFPIAVITNSIVCKRHLRGTGAAGNVAIITRPDPMYLWALRLLLERVSWYIRDHGAGEAIVTFSHLRRFKVQKLHDYRDALRLSETQIWWPAFEARRFRTSDHATTELLQVADITASALQAAIEPDQYGNTEDRYLRNLSPKLYRYGASPITSYGLKVFPTSQANTGGSLYQLREFTPAP